MGLELPYLEGAYTLTSEECSFLGWKTILTSTLSNSHFDGRRTSNDYCGSVGRYLPFHSGLSWNLLYFLRLFVPILLIYQSRSVVLRVW
jgi:hypothetical protein